MYVSSRDLRSWFRFQNLESQISTFDMLRRAEWLFRFCFFNLLPWWFFQVWKVPTSSRVLQNLELTKGVPGVEDAAGVPSIHPTQPGHGAACLRAAPGRGRQLFPPDSSREWQGALNMSQPAERHHSHLLLSKCLFGDSIIKSRGTEISLLTNSSTGTKCRRTCYWPCW